MINNDIKKTTQAVGLQGIYRPGSAQPMVSKAGMFFSTAELKRISDEISRDYAPVIKKKKTRAVNRIKLSASELLEISSWISRVFNPIPNQTQELLLLPLDPGHVYVYWNQPGKQPAMENKKNIVGKHLSLTWFPVEPHRGAGSETAKPLFETTIKGQGQNRRIIALPLIYEGASVVAVMGEQGSDKPLVVPTQSASLRLANHRPSAPRVHPVMPVLTNGSQSPALSSPNRQLTASGQR